MTPDRARALLADNGIAASPAAPAFGASMTPERARELLAKHEQATAKAPVFGAPMTPERARDLLASHEVSQQTPPPPTPPLDIMARAREIAPRMAREVQATHNLLPEGEAAKDTARGVINTIFPPAAPDADNLERAFSHGNQIATRLVEQTVDTASALPALAGAVGAYALGGFVDDPLAPVKAGEAVFKHIGSEIDRLGLPGYIREYPLDVVGLAAAGAGVTRSLLTRGAGVAELASLDAAGAARAGALAEDAANIARASKGRSVISRSDLARGAAEAEGELYQATRGSLPYKARAVGEGVPLADASAPAGIKPTLPPNQVAQKLRGAASSVRRVEDALVAVDPFAASVRGVGKALDALPFAAKKHILPPSRIYKELDVGGGEKFYDLTKDQSRAQNRAIREAMDATGPIKTAEDAARVDDLLRQADPTAPQPHFRVPEGAPQPVGVEGYIPRDFPEIPARPGKRMRKGRRARLEAKLHEQRQAQRAAEVEARMKVGEPAPHFTLDDNVDRFFRGEAVDVVPVRDVRLGLALKHLEDVAEGDPALVLAERRAAFDEALSAARDSGDDAAVAQLAREQTILNMFEAAHGVDEPTKDYLRWVSETFPLQSLENVDAVYLERTPGGGLIPVQQLDPIRRDASAIKTLMTRAGAGSVRRGGVGEESFLAQLDDYHPDFYKATVDNILSDKELMASDGDPRHLINRSSAKMFDRWRRAVNRWAEGLAARREKGLIEDVRYSTARGLVEIVHANAFTDLLDELYSRSNAEGVPLVSTSRGKGFLPLPRKRVYRRLWKRHAETMAARGEKMKGYPQLYVPEEVLHYLEASRELPSTAMRIYQDLLSSWKFWKVAARPGVGFRNTASNVWMSVASGLLGPEVTPSMRYAWKDAVEHTLWGRGGADFDAAHDAGLFERTMGDVELRNELRQLAGKWNGTTPAEMKFSVGWPYRLSADIAENAGFSRVAKGLRGVGKGIGKFKEKATRFYAWQDELFKYARFRQVRHLQREFRRTRTITDEMRRAFSGEDAALKVLDHADDTRAVQAAVDDAHEWFFDYSDIPDTIEHARKFYSPFITFSYKAVPKVAAWAAENPMRAWFMRRLTDYSRFLTEYLDGEGPDEQRLFKHIAERAALPKYSKRDPVYVPGTVQYDTPKGAKTAPQQRFFNPDYYGPGGGILSPEETFSTTNVVPELFQPQHPLIPAVGALFGRPAWNLTGGQLWDPETATSGEVVGKVLGVWARQFLPYFREGQKLASIGKGDYRVGKRQHRVRQFGETLADVVLGLHYETTPAGQGVAQLQRELESHLSRIDRAMQHRLNTDRNAEADPEIQREIAAEADRKKREAIAKFEALIASMRAEASSRASSMGVDQTRPGPPPSPPRMAAPAP